MVDWTCAITPFFILKSLQMPRKRKISVQIILGLGIFGSAAGLVRMGYYHTYDTDTYPNESLCKCTCSNQDCLLLIHFHQITGDILSSGPSWKLAWESWPARCLRSGNCSRSLSQDRLGPLEADQLWEQAMVGLSSVHSTYRKKEVYAAKTALNGTD